MLMRNMMLVLLYLTNTSLAFSDTDALTLYLHRDVKILIAGDEFERIRREQDYDVYEIPFKNGFRYDACTITFEDAREIVIRWTPREDFSDRSAEHYDLQLTFISTGVNSENVVRVSPPKSYKSETIRVLETSGATPTGISFAEKFFQSAFLSLHFAHALGRDSITRRLVQSSVNNLVSHNLPHRELGIMPGFTFETHVSKYGSSLFKSNTSLPTLRELNLRFFEKARVITKYADEGQCTKAKLMVDEILACYSGYSNKEVFSRIKIGVGEKKNFLDLNGIKNHVGNSCIE